MRSLPHALGHKLMRTEDCEAETRMVNPKRKILHAGFTLVELMIALLLGIFLIGAIVLTFVANQNSTRDAEALSRIQESVRISSEYLVRDARNASFRDEDVMLISQESAIRSAYARTVDGALRLRYAGQGHCAQPFTEIRLIENEYSVNDAGELICIGRSVPRDASVLSTLELARVDGVAVEAVGPVVLAAGVQGVEFEFICPADEPNCFSCSGGDCRCELVQNQADTSCLGVTMTLDFQGLRAMGGGGREDRSVALTAAFRNVVLQRIIEGLD
jgi:hypothetical protein